MAMNKVEKAYLTSLETELGLGWPREAEPARTVRPEDTRRPEGAEGYDFNEYTFKVDRFWTTQTSHGRFYEGKRTSGSREARAIYATEREALVAMRWAVCRKMAAELRRIDERLAK